MGEQAGESASSGIITPQTTLAEAHWIWITLWQDYVSGFPGRPTLF